MDLSVRTDALSPTVNRQWVGSKDGIGSTATGTLDLSKCVKATHYPDGFVRAGMALVEYSPGLLGPYDSAATDGRQTPTKDNTYHLWDDIQVLAGRETARVGIPIMWRGLIVTSKLPATANAAAAFKAAASTFRYRTN